MRWKAQSTCDLSCVKLNAFCGEMKEMCDGFCVSLDHYRLAGLDGGVRA